MGALFTVTGVLDTRDAARALRAVLAGSGIVHERIRLTANLGNLDMPDDPGRQVATRARRADRRSSTGGAEAVRCGAYLVSVDVRSLRDRERVEALMAAAGAR